LRREHGTAVRWTVFPLHPGIPAGGILLSDLFPGREAAIREMHARLAGMASEEGLPLVARDRTFDTRLAQELGKWAEEQGAGDAFRDAVFRAYFAGAADIGDPVVLAEIAGAVGLPPDGARMAIGERRYSQAVDADWARAREAGVTAVPTHRFGTRSLVGFAPYADYARLVSPG
jgi:predicted DsbA family dithiol-disulfide isomerase